MINLADSIGSEGILWLAIALFAATYAGILIFSKIRFGVALIAAAVFTLLGIVPFDELPGAVDWNVILMIAGTMGIVSLFIESKMPAKMADVIIEKSPNLKWAIVLLSVFAGIISAFVDNVATVLMVCPIALGISKKLNISPVPSIIAIAIASNLQGAATLVGDTTSMLLAKEAGMTFFDFFAYKPAGESHYGVGLFFTVQIAFLAACAVLLYIFRRDKQKVRLSDRTTVNDLFPTALLAATLILLIAVSFVPAVFNIGGKTFAKPAEMNGIICMSMFLIGEIIYLLSGKAKAAASAIRNIDYETLLLLAGLFVVITGLVNSGAIDVIANLFSRVSGGNLFAIYTILVWFSVGVSAFVDNIPYVATMLPVVTVIASEMGVRPELLYFGLISGATLGGNLTPIGASANIAAIGILRRDGYDVKAGTFMKLSVPYTLTAVAAGYILVWIFWK